MLIPEKVPRVFQRCPIPERPQNTLNIYSSRRNKHYTTDTLTNINTADCELATKTITTTDTSR